MLVTHPHRTQKAGITPPISRSAGWGLLHLLRQCGKGEERLYGSSQTFPLRTDQNKTQKHHANAKAQEYNLADPKPHHGSPTPVSEHLRIVNFSLQIVPLAPKVVVDATGVNIPVVRKAMDTNICGPSLLRGNALKTAYDLVPLSTS